MGDIQLRSALNEPFEARIGLHALGQTRIEDIVVNLASRDTFGQAGLDRPAYLSDLTFTVEADASGQPIIKVNSSQPISEPFIDFLVEMNWPNGRLLREYTVLLDPPLLLDEAPLPIAAATTNSGALFEEEIFADEISAAGDAAPPANQSVVGPRAVQSVVQQEANGAWNSGMVERSATLWSIAQEMQSLSGAEYSTEQIMLALLRSNPEAFYNGNINELRAGHVLRIENPAMIGEVSRAEAIAEVRRQAEQWMAAKGGAAALAENRPQGATEEVSQTGSAGAAVEPDGPRLRLSVPDMVDAQQLAAGTNEGESEAGTAQSLNRELATALEVSESARQENVELRQRLAELEEQLSSMQRLIQLQGDSLATMQLGAAGAETQDDTQTEARVEAQPKPAPVKPVEEPVTEEGNSYLDMLKDYATLLNDPFMMGVAGAAVLLLLTLGWLLQRRRQAARAALEEFSVPTPASVAAAGMKSSAVSAPAPMVASAAGLAVEELDEDAVIDAVASKGETSVDLMQAEEDEIDVLSEADVYLAYRRFDKAEELLKDAMRDHPGRSDLIFKLLEVYSASGNANAFVLHAEALRAALDGRDPATWGKVVAMGRPLVPGHELFGGRSAKPASVAPAAVAAAPAAAVANEDFDLGDFQLDGLEGPSSNFDISSDASINAGAKADELHLDLDVDALSGFGGLAGNDVADVSAQSDADNTESFWKSAGQAQAAPAAKKDGEISFGLDADPGVSLSGMASQPASSALSAGAAGGVNLGGDIDWLSAVGDDFTTLESDPDDEDFSGLISGTDEIGTKLDLAKAYIDMGDQESALSILNEVREGGSEDQQREASVLRRQIG
ncbi:MAG: hypothetical protein LBV36_02855 [Chromatiales bacterium]|nr:hypothetical protein [Chromatiales bacterium]